MKTKEEILAEVIGFELDELTDRTSMPIIDIDDIYTAMEQYATQQVEAATANHDREMVEFIEWADLNWWEWNTHAEALNKFRQSK